MILIIGAHPVKVHPAEGETLASLLEGLKASDGTAISTVVPHWYEGGKPIPDPTVFVLRDSMRVVGVPKIFC